MLEACARNPEEKMVVRADYRDSRQITKEEEVLGR